MKPCDFLCIDYHNSQLLATIIISLKIYIKMHLVPIPMLRCFSVYSTITTVIILISDPAIEVYVVIRYNGIKKILKFFTKEEELCLLLQYWVL